MTSDAFFLLNSYNGSRKADRRIKIGDPELASKFKELQGQSGSAQEFVETLLAAYAERREETDTASPIYKEGVKVRQALAQAERIVTAYLELAANDKIQAETVAQEKIAAAQDEVEQIKEQLSIKADIVAGLESDNSDLEKEIKALKQRIESTETLKAAFAEKEESWQKKESGFVLRITELDVEAKQAREFKNRISGLEKNIAEQMQVIALADQKAGTDKTIINDLKAELKAVKEDHKAEILTLKADSRQMADDHRQSLDELKADSKAAIDVFSSKLAAAEKAVTRRKTGMYQCESGNSQGDRQTGTADC